jgi:hypothetical protein
MGGFCFARIYIYTKTIYMENKLPYIKEYAKIVTDTPYALRTYLKTYDNTQKQFVPFVLFPDQLNLINDFENYNENITKKYRQAGVTTVTAAWISKKLQIAKKDKPEKILIVANKRDTAIEMANKIRGFLVQWPDWINSGFSPDKNSESRFRLNNGCEVKAVATSRDALRGYTPTILVFDEAAYIEGGESFWAASMASLSTGGKVILISTPNGFDPIYYSVYDQALRGNNNFKITDLKWYHDPRYTKDLVWIKVADIVHYMLNRENYPDVEIINESDRKKFPTLIDQGFKPFSSWFELMSAKFNYNRRQIAQELETDFLGSGDGVIPVEIRENIRQNMISEPIEKYLQSTMWQWKNPIQGHRYIMGCDVSRGDSEDYSSINIIDFDEREQVLEYVGKIPPDDLAEIAYRWGILYDCFIVIDITGGMGVATSRKLQDMGYRNLYIDGINVANKWEYNQKALEKIPGINFNNKRTQIIAAFEEQLRKGFVVKSIRLLDEMGTFVYMNGRPDHMKGCHDDSIMSISMALYAGDICFNQLTRNDTQNKAMIESWVISERTYSPEKSFYSYGQSMDPLGSIHTSPSFYHEGNPMNSPKESYQEYKWLFGFNKK